MRNKIMKRILSYMAGGILLLSVVTACEENAALLNPDVGHDKSTVTEETVTSLGYFNSTTSPRNTIIQLMVGDNAPENLRVTDLGVEDEVCFVLTKPAEKELTLKIAMEQDYIEPDEEGYVSPYALQYVSDFKKEHNMVVAPNATDPILGIGIPLGDNLLIDGRKEAIVTIAAGERQSAKVKLIFKRENLSRADILFPIFATDAVTGESYGKIEYVISTYAPATREGKTFLGVAYIDTEVMNPLTADQYRSTVEKYFFDPWRSEVVLRCPTIDITNVRTAFLTQVQGRAILTYTLDMEHVLKNNSRYIQPMRQTGMKVCLVIKGGGTGLGFANLSDSQIADFVAQVKSSITTFGLDGINLWDEGAGYDKEGAVPINTTSYAKLIKALKTAMPDKLITMVDTRETTQSLCEEQAGIRAGEYLDYAWSTLIDFLNPYAADAELKPILGMPMEKYAPVFLPEMMNLSEDEMMEVDEKLMMLCDGMTIINNKFYVFYDLPYMDYGKEGVVISTLMYATMMLYDMNPDPEMMGDGSYMWSSNMERSYAIEDYYMFRKDW